MGPLLEKETKKEWLCEGMQEVKKGKVHTITVPPPRGQKLHHPHDRHFVPDEEREVKGK